MKKPPVWGTVPELLGTIASPNATVPANMAAEQAFLGALLANNRVADRATFLRAEHFIDPIHARIFAAAKALIDAGRVADAVTLKNQFENSGVLEEVGGTAYLAQLLTAMVGIINAGDYARVIQDAWVRRKAMEAGAALIRDALAPEPDPLDPGIGESARTLVARSGDVMSDLLASASAGDKSRSGSIGEAVARVLDSADRQHKAQPGEGDGLFTGIDSLDAIWRGLWPDRMTMLAGRSGHGKTALACQIMRHVASGFVSEDPKPKPRRVQMFSLEMSRDDIAARMLSYETGISTDDILSGKLNGNRAFDLLQAQRFLDGLPIDIVDVRKMTARDIVADATAAVRRNGVRLIVVDHLHRIQMEPSRRGDVTQHVQAAAKAMKDMAGDLHVHVLLLAQIAARTADRDSDDPRPRLAQIGYGGEPEADDVALVWRPEMHIGKEPPDNPKARPETQANAKADWWRKANEVRGKAEVIMAKRRFGPLAPVMLRFDGKRGMFSDLPIDPAAQAQGPLPSLWDEEPPPWGNAT